MAEFDPAQSKLHLYDDTWELNDCCPCDLQFLEFLKKKKIRNATIFHMGTGAHHMVGLHAADNGAISYATGRPLRIDTSDWSDPKRWRPSIHMPRWASRLSLDVVSVGVERLHDIDDEGATREGIQWWSKDGALRKYAPADDEGDGPMWPWRDCPRSPREAFERLWTEVYGPGAPDTNPWVWRVEFTRVEGGR